MPGIMVEKTNETLDFWELLVGRGAGLTYSNDADSHPVATVGSVVAP